MDMIERVARAMKPSTAKLVDRLIDMGADRDEAANLLPLDEARAAIEAMRDPTDEQLEAADIDNDTGGAPYCSDWYFFRNQLNLLLDAALTKS